MLEAGRDRALHRGGRVAQTAAPPAASAASRLGVSASRLFV
jgi:hypothetical protein